MDEVEKLLLIWVTEEELDGDSICKGIICLKALRIDADLRKETPSTSDEGENEFTVKATKD